MVEEAELPREETVDALLETVRELLRVEEARATSLNTRGSGLAGFIGLIVSLSASVGQRALSADLAALPKATAVVLFAGALALLVASVIVVVLRVLVPQSYRNLAMSEVRRYAPPEFVYAEKVMVQGQPKPSTPPADSAWGLTGPTRRSSAFRRESGRYIAVRSPRARHHREGSRSSRW